MILRTFDLLATAQRVLGGEHQYTISSWAHAHSLCVDGSIDEARALVEALEDVEEAGVCREHPQTVERDLANARNVLKMMT